AEDHLLRRTDKTPNTQGARFLGLGPGPGGWGTREMLKAASTGRLKALLLFEFDPWEEPTLRDELSEAMDNLDVLAVWAVQESAVTSRAHIVIPALGYSEKEGTIINFAGRVQHVRKAVPSKGKILPLGEILRQVAIGLNRSWDCRSPEKIWSCLAEENPIFGGIKYEAIGPLGIAVSNTASRGKS
ncbi:MAG: molybdopterin-dependent oxidoreductase, partial [Candidatus Methylomirabilales bacterium]